MDLQKSHEHFESVAKGYTSIGHSLQRIMDLQKSHEHFESVAKVILQ